jgi:hypothetical protein
MLVKVKPYLELVEDDLNKRPQRMRIPQDCQMDVIGLIPVTRPTKQPFQRSIRGQETKRPMIQTTAMNPINAAIAMPNFSICFVVLFIIVVSMFVFTVNLIYQSFS